MCMLPIRLKACGPKPTWWEDKGLDMRNTKSLLERCGRTIHLSLAATVLLFLTGLNEPRAAVGIAPLSLNVTQFGAVGNGRTLCTSAMQAAIDSCSKSGGGTVVVPPGTYVTGSLALGKGVKLYLEKGAILLGSSNMSDWSLGVLILAQDADSVGVNGDGIIDGNGRTFWDHGSRPFVRPNGLLRFEKCTGVSIREIHLINSPKFTVYLDGCTHVQIEGIQIKNSLDSPNTDGVDVANSSNVLITGCYMETGDDAVCLKSSRRGSVVAHVVVRNCRLVTDDTALKLGTGSKGTISDCTFTGIEIPEATNGIGLFMKDGGAFERIEFSDISMMSTARPLKQYFPRNGGAAYWLEVLKKREDFPIFVDSESRSPNSSVGTIRNIAFRNLEIRTSDGNCLLEGRKERSLVGITMSDIRMIVEREKSYVGRTKPRGTRTLREKSSNDYASVPSYFTFAYVEGLRLRNLVVEVSREAGSFPMYGVWGNSVNGASVDSVKIISRHEVKGRPVIKFTRSKNVAIDGRAL